MKHPPAADQANKTVAHGLAARLRSNQFPLLITGIAGVAGYNAFNYLRRKYGAQVIGQRPVNTWRLEGPGVVALDLEDAPSVQRLFARHRFRSVLSCGGSCALRPCELDPAMARRVNVGAVQSLLDTCPPATRLVHLSIDLVFAGTNAGRYREGDPCDPVTVYGATMVLGEQLVQTSRPDACVVRISLPMGISFNGHAGAIDWIQNRFANNRPATLYYDEVRTPTYVDCLNGVFEQLLAGRASGVFHAGGPRCLSLYEIAQIVNRVGGYRPELLRGCYRIEAGPVPPRAGNVSISAERLGRLLGVKPFSPWPLWDELVPTDRNWHFDRSRFGTRAGPKWLAQTLYRRPSGIAVL